MKKAITARLSYRFVRNSNGSWHENIINF